MPVISSNPLLKKAPLFLTLIPITLTRKHLFWNPSQPNINFWDLFLFPIKYLFERFSFGCVFLWAKRSNNAPNREHILQCLFEETSILLHAPPTFPYLHIYKHTHIYDSWDFFHIQNSFGQSPKNTHPKLIFRNTIFQWFQPAAPSELRQNYIVHTHFGKYTHFGLRNALWILYGPKQLRFKQFNRNGLYQSQSVATNTPRSGIGLIKWLIDVSIESKKRSSGFPLRNGQEILLNLKFSVCIKCIQSYNCHLFMSNKLFFDYHSRRTRGV